MLTIPDYAHFRVSGSYNIVQLEGDSMYPTMNSQLGAKDVVLIEYWNVKRRQLKL